VLVPSELRAAAALERDVMLLGMATHFELWDLARLGADEQSQLGRLCRNPRRRFRSKRGLSSSSAASGSGHRTVMAEAAVAMLVTDPEATYVDATYGRGGHARRILQRLGNSGRLIALDRDPDAEADARFVADVRFEFVRTRFSRLGEVLDARSISAISGLLMDLGVSSPQLDDAARGFSLRLDGRSTCGWIRTVVSRWPSGWPAPTWPKCGESCASSAMSGLLRRLPKRS